MKQKILLLSIISIFLASNVWALSIMGDLANLEGTAADFSGSFMYTALNDTSATVVVQLENTSPLANGGYLTAFAFNNPGDLITDASLASTSGTFDTLLGGATFSDSVLAEPFGDFDLGGASTSSWIGGGSPTGGIAVGDSETFTFSLIGSGFLGLTEQSFIDTLSENGNSSYWFAARFRGFIDDGSSKLPGIPDEPEPVPEPATLLLLGVGLIGLATYGRKRRKI